MCITQRIQVKEKVALQEWKSGFISLPEQEGEAGTSLVPLYTSDDFAPHIAQSSTERWTKYYSRKTKLLLSDGEQHENLALGDLHQQVVRRLQGTVQYLWDTYYRLIHKSSMHNSQPIYRVKQSSHGSHRKCFHLNWRALVTTAPNWGSSHTSHSPGRAD